MKNSTLKIALICVRILKIGTAFIGLALISMSIVWYTSGSLFDLLYLTHETGGGYAFASNPEDVNIITLSQTSGFLYGILITKSIAQLVLLFFLCDHACKIIRSANSLESFKVGNITTLKKMAGLFFLWFLTDIVSITPQLSNGVSIHIGTKLNYLIAAIICSVLAEIFKEGNNLKEENKLTI